MRIVAVLFAVLLGCLSPAQPAYCAPAMVTGIDLAVRQGQLMLDADMVFDLKPELDEAARKGVSLYLTADIDIVQPRWWWFDRMMLSTEISWRIQYNALTRQWRVGTGSLSLPANSLDEALDVVRHVRDLALMPADELETGETYHGRMRLRLDTSRLARPFQIDALNSRAWSLMTPWKNFTFSITAATPSN